MSAVVLIPPAIDRWNDHAINCEQCWASERTASIPPCSFGIKLLRIIREG